MGSQQAPPNLPVADMGFDSVDKAAIAFLVLPLLLFLPGWLTPWVGVPALLWVLYSLRCVLRAQRGPRQTMSRAPLAVAALVAILWVLPSGIGHYSFANADWNVRDAVLHDLVVAQWPVGYALQEGGGLLRTTLAYFLPAALVGKLTNLQAAHLALLLWTMAGVGIFLLQVQKLVPAGRAAIPVVLLIVVLFSGMDAVGRLLLDGRSAVEIWVPGQHIEWWAGRYQYSSMTTLLYWVPNHALGAWLTLGLILRHSGAVRRECMLQVLPTLLVAAALWSPLSALGLLPFAAWLVMQAPPDSRHRLRLFAGWVLTGVAGVPVAVYLTLDAFGIDRSVYSLSGDGVQLLLQHLSFFLLEGGILGLVILAIRPSAHVGLAMVILALLPWFRLGESNDLVMRTSIPALAVLAICAASVMVTRVSDSRSKRLRLLLGVLLVLGSITPLNELARACLLPAWPASPRDTVVDAWCGRVAPHYIAQIGEGWQQRMLRQPSLLQTGTPQSGASRARPRDAATCVNPGLDLMRAEGMW